MAYLQSSPKGNPNTEKKNPLKNPIGRKQPPNIIEKRSSKLMISIRKANPNPQENSYLKHQEHVLSVGRNVISRKSVELRPKPLSIPSLVIEPIKKKSSNY